MKAAVFHAREDVRIEDIPVPTPGKGMVKLCNAYSGICGSDLHVYFEPDASGMDFSHPVGDREPDTRRSRLTL